MHLLALKLFFIIVVTITSLTLFKYKFVEGNLLTAGVRRFSTLYKDIASVQNNLFFDEFSKNRNNLKILED